jgi:1-acyl-sn-glycerol-3-phosphate acyltransferase
LYLINIFITRVMWRTHVDGRLPLSRGQGAVIVSNHRSGIDPLVIALTTRRPVHWMVAREFVESPVVGWGLRALQVIPVGRKGIDTAAIRAAIRYAQRGDLVGVFPEGRINTTGEILLPGRPGAALIALKAGLPIIPCYVDGTPYDGTSVGPLFMIARARLRLGQLIDTSSYVARGTDRDVLDELTLRILREIASLAGHPEYEPSLAGRQWKPAPDQPEA